MSVKEIEEAIARLPAEELSELVAWLEEYRADAWDCQIEEDAASGRLDALADEADREFEAGSCWPL